MQSMVKDVVSGFLTLVLTTLKSIINNAISNSLKKNKNSVIVSMNENRTLSLKNGNSFFSLNIVNSSEITSFLINSKILFKGSNLPVLSDINPLLNPNSNLQSVVLTGSGILFQLLDLIGPGIYQLIIDTISSIIINVFANSLPISMDDASFLNLIKNITGISNISFSSLFGASYQDFEGVLNPIIGLIENPNNTNIIDKLSDINYETLINWLAILNLIIGIPIILIANIIDGGLRYLLGLAKINSKSNSDKIRIALDEVFMCNIIDNIGNHILAVSSVQKSNLGPIFFKEFILMQKVFFMSQLVSVQPNNFPSLAAAMLEAFGQFALYTATIFVWKFAIDTKIIPKPKNINTDFNLRYKIYLGLEIFIEIFLNLLGIILAVGLKQDLFSIYSTLNEGKAIYDGYFELLAPSSDEETEVKIIEINYILYTAIWISGELAATFEYSG